MYEFSDYEKSADFIREKLKHHVDTALVLGSGLGGLDEKIEDAVVIKYEDIPNFPKSTVTGHKGQLVAGKLNGKNIIVQSGRFHFYEGYTFEQSAFAVRVFKLLGVKTIILTNAAGGINKDFRAGDIMVISDHIKFFYDSPLLGKNLDEFGPRFNDLSVAYKKELIALAHLAAKETGLDLKQGVYAFMPGPSFETPAEIRALSILGADAVGMSTVSEVISACHCGIDVLGISCISNMAAGISKQALSHKEVLDNAKVIEQKLLRFLECVINKL